MEYRVGDEVMLRLWGTCLEERLGLIDAINDTEEGRRYVIDMLFTESDDDHPDVISEKLQTVSLPAEDFDHAAW